MLKRLTSASGYLDFVNEINSDPNFSDPNLTSKEQIQHNLLDAPNRPSHQIWGVFEEEEIIGLFAFLVLEDEAYIEMLVGLSRSSKAYMRCCYF